MPRILHSREGIQNHMHNTILPFPDVDECVNVTCENGGTCQHLVGSFRCFCETGFTGDYCETSEWIYHTGYTRILLQCFSTSRKHLGFFVFFPCRHWWLRQRDVQLRHVWGPSEWLLLQLHCWIHRRPLWSWCKPHNNFLSTWNMQKHNIYIQSKTWMLQK